MTGREDLLKYGFSQNEINEIEAGLKEGVDVTVYASKKFHSIQMRQIRIGLGKKLDVSKYADPQFDWLQMEEIRRGLESQVDISIYSKPEIPYDKMRQIRKGLEIGIDLTEYLNYEAGIIRQIRKAKLDNVDIFEFVEAGYDKEQLVEIRIAVKSHIDLRPYLLKEYAAPSIAEIRKGLEVGADISQYAKPEYSWLQMREIRLGMEHRVDTGKYLSPYFTWKQMKEIRKGLEEGFDVSDYGRLRFPAAEMRRRRHLLRKRTEGEVTSPELTNVLDGVVKASELENILDDIAKAPEQKPDLSANIDHMHLNVDSNGMAAFLLVSQKRDITQKDLQLAFNLAGIKVGFDNGQMEKIMAGNYQLNTPILVASGKIAHKGEDGYYEYLFRTDVKKIPKVKTDGTVDYKNVEWFETVREGQIIAIYHEAKEGIDGYTVTGVKIPAKKGLEQKLLSGAGFVLGEDRKTYRAEFTGMVSVDIEGLRLEVSRHLEVDRVNFATGNIRFDGSVHILGTVENGMRIEATDDVVVDGSVESATIISGGSIVIKQGMNAAAGGFLKAKKSVNGRFFESVRIEAGEDISANSFLNCELHADGKIESTIALSGGLASALKGFVVNHIGNKAGLRTFLQVAINDNIRREKQRLKGRQMEVQNELTVLKNAYNEIQEKYPPEIRNTMELYLKIENAIYTKQIEFNDLVVKENEIVKTIMKEQDAKVVIKGTAFEGTMIDMGRMRWRAKGESNVTVKRAELDIDVVPN